MTDLMDVPMMPPMSAPRVAAGALFRDEQGRFMLVKPTYKPGWDIPGGYVEPGETPAQACEREVREELGLDKQPGALLVADWAPSDAEGDKLLFVFDGGRLGHAEVEDIQLQREEIAEIRFYEPGDFPKVLPDRLVRRLSAAVEAHRRGSSIYLEHGGVHRASGPQKAIAGGGHDSPPPHTVGRSQTRGRDLA